MPSKKQIADEEEAKANSHTRAGVKTALDTTGMALMGLGTAGLTMAIYNANWIAGIFGGVTLVLGIGCVGGRHIWNEKNLLKGK